MESGLNLLMEYSDGHYTDFTDANKVVLISGGVPATARPVLIGITKASLETNGFLLVCGFPSRKQLVFLQTQRSVVERPSPLNLRKIFIIGKDYSCRYRYSSLP